MDSFMINLLDPIFNILQFCVSFFPLFSKLSKIQNSPPIGKWSSNGPKFFGALSITELDVPTMGVQIANLKN